MLFARQKSKKERPVAITFTGGMGAQIVSAAIYYHLEHEGRPVIADFSYFNAK